MGRGRLQSADGVLGLCVLTTLAQFNEHAESTHRRLAQANRTFLFKKCACRFLSWDLFLRFPDTRVHVLSLWEGCIHFSFHWRGDGSATPLWRPAVSSCSVPGQQQSLTFLLPNLWCSKQWVVSGCSQPGSGMVSQQAGPMERITQLLAGHFC